MSPAEEVNGKLRLLHRIATALALMSVGALTSISKLSLRMWGGEGTQACETRAKKEQQGGDNSGLKNEKRKYDDGQ